ncbi:MAG TPA: MFS transporter, partial [Candidatus Paceibacterota bacterium]|nr:MFS transporter [Candidatus Paceibacterota bacterium]
MFFLKNTNNKRIGLWLLYDFANSLAFANLSFYFTLWLVEDRNFSDMWVSIPAALATVCLLLTIPHFGSLSDRTGKRMVFLRTFSWLSIACLFLIGLTALLSESKVMVAVVVVLYFCFLYFYQSSLVFY